MNFNAPKHLVLFAFLAIGIVGCGVEEVETPVPTTNTTPTTSGTDNTTPDAPADTTPDSNNNTDTNTPNDDSNDGSNGNSNDTPASEPELMFMDCGDPEGNAEFEVEFDGTNLLADWGTDKLLGFYVTAPDANLPGGPGQTVSGTAYWVLEGPFPMGFAGPVTYGVVPSGADEATVKHGGDDAGGSVLAEGICYMVSITTTSFQSGSVFIGWEYR